MLPEHLSFQAVDQVNKRKKIKITEQVGCKTMGDELQAVESPYEITDEVPLFPFKIFPKAVSAQ